ncbi:MAG: hypothetical protein MJE77_13955 [Proteobacteria bacterium]|nr:hypothetical protein [Pseudomonadota bacterium]
MKRLTMQQLEQLALWTIRPIEARQRHPPRAEHLQLLAQELSSVSTRCAYSGNDVIALQKVADAQVPPTSTLVWRCVATVYSARLGKPWRRGCLHV